MLKNNILKFQDYIHNLYEKVDYDEKTMRWITIHDKKHQQQKILITKKDGTIVAGLGGKYNGKKLDSVYSNNNDSSDNDVSIKNMSYKEVKSKINKSLNDIQKNYSDTEITDDDINDYDSLSKKKEKAEKRLEQLKALNKLDDMANKSDFDFDMEDPLAALDDIFDDNYQNINDVIRDTEKNIKDLDNRLYNIKSRTDEIEKNRKNSLKLRDIQDKADISEGNLTDTQRESLKNYLDPENREAIDSLYRKNSSKLLSTSSKRLSPEERKMVSISNQISEALSKNKTKEPMITYGTLSDNFDNLEIGQSFSPSNTFFSSSTSKDRAMDSRVSKNDYTVEIQIPKGAKAAYVGSLSKNKNFGEVLIDKESKFEVMAIDKKNKKMVIKLTD